MKRVKKEKYRILFQNKQLMDPTFLNRYNYTNSNPVMFGDPTGESYTLVGMSATVTINLTITAIKITAYTLLAALVVKAVDEAYCLSMYELCKATSKLQKNRRKGPFDAQCQDCWQQCRYDGYWDFDRCPIFK